MKRKVLVFLFCAISTYAAYYCLIKFVMLDRFDYRGAVHSVIEDLMADQSLPDATTLILGDSSISASLIPDVFGPKVFNFAIWGADSRMAKTVLERYLSFHQSAPKCLVLGLSYTHKLRYQDNLFYEVFLFNDLYSFKEMFEIYDESKQYNTFPARDESPIKYFGLGTAAKLKFHGYTLPQLQNTLWPWGHSPESDWKGYKKRVRFNRGYAYLNARNKLSDDDFNYFAKYFESGFYADKTYDVFLNQMIELATSKGIQFFFLIPPKLDLQEYPYVAKYNEDFYAYLDDKKQIYPELKILKPDFDMKNKAYFYNMNHLNTVGAPLFSQSVKSLMPEECFE